MRGDACVFDREGKGRLVHYMYVVKCADGTLYTGYSPDVEARVAAHNAGKGAKYTKTRRPVELVGSAAFETKHEAMSAEWHFKQLSRAQKDALLARMSPSEPLEDILTEAFNDEKGRVEECRKGTGATCHFEATSDCGDARGAAVPAGYKETGAMRH